MKAIMYHYVRRERDEYPYFRYLHEDDFFKQLDFFSSQHCFVSRDEFTAYFKTKDVPRHDGIVLTFDDGIKDHLYISRELNKRGVWGIFYIPTGHYQTGKLLDVHRVHMILGKIGGEAALRALEENMLPNMVDDHHIAKFKEKTYLNQSNDEATERFKKSLNYYIKEECKSLILDKLMELIFEDERKIASEFYLSQEDIKEMSDLGMIIGSHGVSHAVMSKLPREKQRDEIIHSDTFIRQIIPANAVKTFCYPYGGFHSFTSETEEILNQEGFLFSFNVEQRDISAEDIRRRPQALPRFDCNKFSFGVARRGGS